MQKNTLTIAVIIIVIAGIAALTVRKPAPPRTGTPVTGDELELPSTLPTDTLTTLAGSISPLYEFNQAAYDQALAENKLVVLYFYASWCPDCRAEFPLAQAAFDQLTSSEVVGFRVHYNDDETTTAERALAQTFGVAYQHTKVFVRGTERVLKSPESWNTARYLQEITNQL